MTTTRDRARTFRGALQRALDDRDRHRAPVKATRILGRNRDGTIRLLALDGECEIRGAVETGYEGQVVTRPLGTPFSLYGAAGVAGQSWSFGSALLDVTALEPAVYSPGESYTVTVTGRGFDNAFVRDFLTDDDGDTIAPITVVEQRILSSTSLELDIEVDAGAALVDSAALAFGRTGSAGAPGATTELRRRKRGAYSVELGLGGPLFAFYVDSPGRTLHAWECSPSGAWVADRGSLDLSFVDSMSPYNFDAFYSLNRTNGMALRAAVTGIARTLSPGTLVANLVRRHRLVNLDQLDDLYLVWSPDSAFAAIGRVFNDDVNDDRVFGGPVIHESSGIMVSMTTWLRGVPGETWIHRTLNKVGSATAFGSPPVNSFAQSESPWIFHSPDNWSITSGDGGWESSNGLALFANGEVWAFGTNLPEANLRFSWIPEVSTDATQYDDELGLFLPGPAGGPPAVGISSSGTTLQQIDEQVLATAVVSDLWPTTTPWQLDTIRNVSVSLDGTDALLFGVWTGDGTLIRAKTQDFGASPQLRATIEPHPTLGVLPDVIYLGY